MRKRFIIPIMLIPNIPIGLMITVKLSEIEKFYLLENRMYSLLAESKNIPLIDVASVLMRYLDLFFDGIHLPEEGMKLHGFIVFLGLLEEVEKLICEDVQSKEPIKDFKFNKIQKVSFDVKSNFYYKNLICD
jgi:hypothetical protein